MQPAAADREKFEPGRNDAAEAAWLAAAAGCPGGSGALAAAGRSLVLGQNLPSQEPVRCSAAVFAQEARNCAAACCAFWSRFNWWTSSWIGQAPTGFRSSEGTACAALALERPLAVGGVEQAARSRPVAAARGRNWGAICYELLRWCRHLAAASGTVPAGCWLRQPHPYRFLLQAQFSALAQLRAIEQALASVSSANTGSQAR